MHLADAQLAAGRDVDLAPWFAADGVDEWLGLVVASTAIPDQARGTVIPEPRRDKPHRDAWALWPRRHQYQPSKPTSDGMPTPTRRQGNDLQLPYPRIR